MAGDYSERWWSADLPLFQDTSSFCFKFFLVAKHGRRTDHCCLVSFTLLQTDYNEAVVVVDACCTSFHYTREDYDSVAELHVLNHPLSALQVHPYTSWIPLTLFIVVRNILPKFRIWSLRLYGWLGCITLETYLCQFHIWLHTDVPDGQPKYLLSLVPGYPLINFAVCTACEYGQLVPSRPLCNYHSVN